MNKRQFLSTLAGISAFPSLEMFSPHNKTKSPKKQKAPRQRNLFFSQLFVPIKYHTDSFFQHVSVSPDTHKYMTEYIENDKVVYERTDKKVMYLCHTNKESWPICQIKVPIDNPHAFSK